MGSEDQMPSFGTYLSRASWSCATWYFYQKIPPMLQSALWHMWGPSRPRNDTDIIKARPRYNKKWEHGREMLGVAMTGQFWFLELTSTTLPKLTTIYLSNHLRFKLEHDHWCQRLRCQVLARIWVCHHAHVQHDICVNKSRQCSTVHSDTCEVMHDPDMTQTSSKHPLDK